MLVVNRNKERQTGKSKWKNGNTYIEGMKLKDGVCNLICVYNNEGMNKLTVSLEKVCEKLREQNLIIVGDLNAKV